MQNTTTKFSLNNLSRKIGKSKRRLGRGIGSTTGKTCGRGHKGQKARQGYSKRASFEGGQMSLFRRIPKSGFTSRVQSQVEVLSIHKLATLSTSNDFITMATLKSLKLIKRKTEKVRLILSRAPSTPMFISKDENIHITKGALAHILAHGGQVS